MVDKGSRNTAPGHGATPFGVRLRRLREAAGLTQEELASKAGLTPKAVGVLERGERKRPYPHTVRGLADALGLADRERALLFASVPGRRAAPAPSAVAPVPVSVPAPPTPLVGREREVEAVNDILRWRRTRLLTLTGPGGVGKTRLALEAVRRAAGNFPDGAAFVALAPLDDASLVMTTIIRTLGFREAGGDSSRDALQSHLSGKELLLVLDNFEHVMSAAPELAGLLGSCPGLVLLVTSRAPLRLRGEREYLVPPLAVPDPSRAPDVKTVNGSPAARLFLERAWEASSAFLLTRKNAASVAAICWRLDGLPLALELAAAQARFLGPTELLSRMDQALEAGGARDLPERQRTMRSTLDWGHDLLSPEERILFRRLSVFAGGFALEAAEAVGAGGEVGGEEVLGLLGRLVEQSLVSVEPGADAATRYGMLEPVHQYALGKLSESGEEQRVRARHAAYFGDLAVRAGPELKRAEQASWLERLALEHDNLRAALSCLLERGEAERVARIGWAIHRFWSLRGHTGEGRRWMERALARPVELSDGARARALYVVSMLSYFRGEMNRTVQAAEESIAVSRAVGDSEALAAALLGRGLTALGAGDLDAEKTLRDALAMFRKRDDRPGASLGLVGLAQVELARGDFDRATELLAEAEVTSRSVEDWFTLIAVLSGQALAMRLRGDQDRTSALLRESVRLAGTLGDAWHVVFGMTGLAGGAARQGRPERAARLFGAAEVLCETMGVDVPSPAWRALNERDLALARELLNVEAFDAAWAEGRAMTMHETVAAALAKGT
jgi:predicted ATPase/transcriptional regulator with XRE-family HTH domain